MIVDVHTHAFPDAVAGPAMARLAAEGGIPAYADGTVAGLVREMDRAGIDVAVLQPVATNPASVARVNDWAASTASERIVPFGAMHPDLADAPAEIERMAALGMRGFKLHPEYQAFGPAEPRLEPVLRAAAEHGMTVLFHAGADHAFDTVRGAPEAFAAMLDAHPGLVAVLAHMGGFREWEGVSRHLVGRDVYFDTAFTLGHLPDEEFVRIVRAHGVGRVLFGTDGPWTRMAEELRRLRSLPLSAEELDAILGGNAAGLLGLSPRGD
ncbi:MAG: amidohydrolase family protein [Coriobacteriia bacterium]|nr:amidohydrolase family protein [Coriobacteriia bacterium]